MAPLLWLIVLALTACIANGLEHHEITAFEKTLDGTLVRPSDKSYKQEKMIWNQRRCGSSPAIIVLPESYQDVAKTIQFTRKHNIHPRIKSGGHNFAGWNQQDNGWVIYTRKLDKMQILPGDSENANRMRLGAGLKFNKIYKYLEGSGLLFPGGTCPTVGVSGFFLGGGHSPIGRVYGASSDSIIEMKVVTADGAIITVSKDKHADLFWGLTGSGHGNFGVVVEFLVQLYRGPTKSQFHGKISWLLPSEKKTKRVIMALDAYMENAPREMTFQLHSFPGYLKLQFIYIGVPSVGEALIEKFLTTLPRRGKVLTRIGSQRDYVALSEKTLGKDPLPTRTYFKTGLYRSFSKQYIDALVEESKQWTPIHEHRLGLGVFIITTLGGAFSDANSASSLAHREAKYVVEYTASWFLSHDDARWMRTIEKSKARLDAKADFVGTYVNYQDENLKNWETSYYGNNVHRLQILKDKWDPTGLFETQHGIYTSGVSRPKY